jgi:glycosyltransferase involved in cell wall biosynthesis
MKIANTRVSIGLPIYNGENFMREAIDSLLSQTFEDFELIISDNASTDQTEAICRDYAAMDKRVKYNRNPTNVGASGNYTRVFERSSGKYFRWAAHDDICKPDYLEQCVAVLDADPSIVLCHSRTASIDPQGRKIKKWVPRPNLCSADTLTRLRDVLDHRETFHIWGLMRRDILAKTPLLGDYPAHDRPLLAELSLYGRFHELSEFMFLDREHPNRSVRRYDAADPHKAVAWYDPKKAGKLIYPEWCLFAEYIRAINRAPLTVSERLASYREMGKWFVGHQGELARDVRIAVEHIPGIGPHLDTVFQWYSRARWARLVGQATQKLEKIITPGKTFILVDEGNIERQAFAKWRAIPFLEHDGEYWGAPTGDAQAIEELERLRQSGASHIAFTWLAFWWFDHYTDFFDYLRTHCRRVLTDSHLVVYELEGKQRVRAGEGNNTGAWQGGIRD